MADQCFLQLLKHITGMDLETLTTELAEVYPDAARRGILRTSAPVNPLVLLQAIVNEYNTYGYNVADVLGRGRKEELVYVRHNAIAILYEVTGMTQIRIGQLFGSRDHTMVGYAIQNASRTTATYRRALAAVRALMGKGEQNELERTA